MDKLKKALKFVVMQRKADEEREVYKKMLDIKSERK